MNHRLLTRPAWRTRTLAVLALAHCCALGAGALIGMSAGAASAAPAALRQPEVSVVSFRLVEISGDRDGYPDTNETADLFLTLHNPTQLPELSNVVIQLTTTDPRIDCLDPSLAVVDSLPAGADIEIPTPFRLHVHPAADRAGASVACVNSGPSGTCSNFVEVPGGCSSTADCQRTFLQDYSAELRVSITSDQYPAPGPVPHRSRSTST